MDIKTTSFSEIFKERKFRGDAVFQKFARKYSAKYYANLKNKFHENPHFVKPHNLCGFTEM